MRPRSEILGATVRHSVCALCTAHEEGATVRHSVCALCVAHVGDYGKVARGRDRVLRYVCNIREMIHVLPTFGYSSSGAQSDKQEVKYGEIARYEWVCA